MALINYNPLFYSIIFLSSASIISLILSIVSFLFQKSLHIYSYKQIMYLFISTLISTYAYLIYFNQVHEQSDFICQGQAFLILWFEQSQFIWSALISYTTYKITTEALGEDYVPPVNAQKGYLYLGFVFPFANTAFASLNKLLGPSGYWCWISSASTAGEIFTWATYIFYWSAIGVNLFFTIRVIIYVKNLAIDKKEKEIISKALWKLFSYPLIQIIVTVPASANKIINYFVKEVNTVNAIFIIRCISILLICSQGLMLSLVYGINLNLFCSLFKNCKKKRSQNCQTVQKVSMRCFQMITINSLMTSMVIINIYNLFKINKMLLKLI